MFGIGLPEILVILIVALIVVGPSRLPELAKSLGKALNEFRKMADDVKGTIQEEVSKEELSEETVVKQEIISNDKKKKDIAETPNI
jgi:Tat protein translocase TatB subunit